MEFQDRTLVCKDCGKEFTFTAGEQEFYKEKGFENDPVRCRDCRGKRRRSHDGDSGERTMFQVTCAACGKETEVPFEPKLCTPLSDGSLRDGFLISDKTQTFVAYGTVSSCFIC